MDVVLGVAVTGPVARLALVGSAAEGRGVIDQSEVELTGDATELLTETIAGTHRLLAQDGHRLAATRVHWSDQGHAEQLRHQLAGAGVPDVGVVSGADAATALVRHSGARGDSALLLVDDDTATLTIVGADDVTTSVIAAEPVGPTGAVTACNTLLDRLREEPGAAENLYLVSTAADVSAYADQLRAVSPVPLDVPDQPAFAIARGAAMTGGVDTGAVTTPAPVPGGQLAYSMADDSPLPVEMADYSAYDLPLQTPMAPLSETPETESDEPAAADRPRMLLVGSAVAGTAVVAFAALAVTVAIGIRPAADVEPLIASGPVIPEVYYPPSPAEEWKQEQIDPPLPPPPPSTLEKLGAGNPWAGSGIRDVTNITGPIGNGPIGTVPFPPVNPFPPGPPVPVGAAPFDATQAVVNPINAFLGARTSCEYILMGRLVNNSIREVTTGLANVVREVSRNGTLEVTDEKGDVTAYKPGGEIEQVTKAGTIRTLKPTGEFVEKADDGTITTVLPGGVGEKILPSGDVEKLAPEELQRVLPGVDNDPRTTLSPFDAFKPNQTLVPDGPERLDPTDDLPGSTLDAIPGTDIKDAIENPIGDSKLDPGVKDAGPLGPIEGRNPFGGRPDIGDVTPPAPGSGVPDIGIKAPDPIKVPDIGIKPPAPVKVPDVDVPDVAPPVIDIPEPVAPPVIDIPEPVSPPVIDIPEPVAPPVVDIPEPVIDIPEPASPPVIDIPKPAAPALPDLKIPSIFGGGGSGSGGSGSSDTPSLPELPNLFNPFG